MTETMPSYEDNKAPEMIENLYAEKDKVQQLETVTDHENKTIDIEGIRRELLEQPPTPLELPIDETAEGRQPQYIDKALKKIALKKELTQIRDELTPGQKSFSRFIHHPAISRKSEICAKTIARPLGFLYGSAFAFLGSISLLFFDKFIGISYNYLVFVYLFLFGYVVSILVELLSKALSKNKNELH